jgi:Arc/MetJ-type ribon-helix-helix transcriptional regulator
MVVSVFILPSRNVTKVVTVKMSEEMFSFVKERCEKEGVSMGKLVRDAILYYLREEPVGESREVIHETERIEHVKVFSFKMSKLFLARVDGYAINHRVSRSDVIRSSIFYYLMRGKECK